MEKYQIVAAVLACVMIIQNLILLLSDKKRARLTKVENKDKRWSASDHYWHIEAYIDGKLTDLLMTDKELEDLKERADKNPEDIPW